MTKGEALETVRRLREAIDVSCSGRFLRFDEEKLRDKGILEVFVDKVGTFSGKTVDEVAAKVNKEVKPL